MCRFGWVALCLLACDDDASNVDPGIPPDMAPTFDGSADVHSGDAAVVDQAIPDEGPDDAAMPDAALPVLDDVVGLQVAAGRHLSATWVAGRPAVAWYDPDARALRFARALVDAPRTSADWSRYTLHADGRYPSLQVVDGRPAVAFYDATEGQLRYAHADTPAPRPNDWSIHTIDADGNPGAFADMVVSGERVVIAYQDSATGALRVATATQSPPANIAHWRVELVDEEGDTGHFASVALVGGRPVVAYHDATSTSLKRAALTEEGWQVETIDDDGAVGRYCDLAPDGRLVSYRDDERGTLNVAFAGVEGWTIVRVDETGDAGAFSEVHLGFGYPVVTYVDERTHRLKKASFDGEGWRLARIDTPEEVGGGALLAAHPCGGVDDLGIGAHTGLYVYRAADSGRLEMAYDATDSAPWFRHPVHHALRDATGSVLLPNDVPTVAYTTASRGVRQAMATTWPPTDSRHWHDHAVLEGGSATGLVTAQGPAGPMLAWSGRPEGAAESAIYFARALGEAAGETEDWVVHPVATNLPDAPVGLVVVGGRPALAVPDAEGLRYLRANTETPESADDWVGHALLPGGLQTHTAALTLVDDRPAVFYGATLEDGRASVVFAHATVPEPAGSADWSTRHDVGAELAEGMRPRLLSAASVAGRAAVAFATVGLHYVRARDLAPTEAGDWQAHEPDGTIVPRSPMLADRDGTPALLYAVLAPGASLRLATTGTAAPSGRQAWTFSQIDGREGPSTLFTPRGVGDYRDQRAVLYESGSCLMMARAR